MRRGGWKIMLVAVAILWLPTAVASGADIGFENEIASIIFGGSAADGGWPRTSMAIADNGNVYVVGSTRSSDFPVTNDSDSPSGRVDCFIALINAELTELIACRLVGGAEDDFCTSVAIGPDGSIYVAGHTSSADFPTTPSAYSSVRKGSDDVFLMRWDAELSHPIASTLLGGRASDNDPALDLDSAGRVVVVGQTTSDDFPTTEGAFTESYNSRSGSGWAGNLFVALLSEDLAQLEASTFLGGSTSDDKPSLAIADDGSIYVCGTTSYEQFPVTGDAYQTEGGMGFWIYLSKLDSSLTNLLASTFIGQGCFGYDVAIDEASNVWVAAHVVGPFPATTEEAALARVNGPADAGVVCLNGDLELVVGGRLVGGSSNDCAMQVIADGDGRIYLSGYTSSSNFPGSELSARSGTNAFVCAIDRVTMNFDAIKTLGGDETEEANMIALAPSGDLYMSGSTSSTDFPVSGGVVGPTGGSSQLWGGDIYVMVYGD